MQAPSDVLQRTIGHDGRTALGDNLAIMKTLAVLFCLTLPVAAFAQAAPADGALRPTRMQMCQHELKDVPEAQRKTQFNTCLQRRAKGEVAMERDCRRESQAIMGAKVSETEALRRDAMRSCMAQGLARPYAELPGGAGVRKTADAKPKPAAAKVVPTSNQPGADAGKTPKATKTSTSTSTNTSTGKDSKALSAPSSAKDSAKSKTKDVATEGKPKLLKTSAAAGAEAKSSAR